MRIISLLGGKQEIVPESERERNLLTAFVQDLAGRRILADVRGNGVEFSLTLSPAGPRITAP